MARRRKKAVPILSAAWINPVVDKVLETVETLWDGLIDDGLLASGYLPFETPLSPKIIRRMTSEQVKALLDQTASLEDQAAILQALEGLPATVVPEPTQPARAR